jgi:hypothetical protein
MGFFATVFFTAFFTTGFLAAAASAASAFFFAATLAVVEPFEGIAIGPFLDEGLEVLESQGLRFGSFLTDLNNFAMSSGLRVSF